MGRPVTSDVPRVETTGLNTKVDKKVFQEFKDHCSYLGYPMNVVLETFMQQYSNGRFHLDADEITKFKLNETGENDVLNSSFNKAIYTKFRETCKANGFFVKYVIMALMEKFASKAYILEYVPITEVCNGSLVATGISTGNDEPLAGDPSPTTVEWEYANIGNNTIEITACKGKLPAEIIFPSCIDGKTVVSIGSAVFGAAKTNDADRLRVESVFVPQGVTSIGSSVFAGCKALKKVILPQGLSSIGDNAFQNCKTLATVSIPDSVTHIGSGAFSGSNIQSIVLPGGIGSVPVEGFKNCKKLVSVTVLEGVTSIQREAFYNCKSITSVRLPEGLVSIERNAFYCCRALRNIPLPNSIKVIGYQAFEWCSLTIETLPTSLTVIENSSFEGCDFTTLTIPEGVTKIEDFAFNQCWSLRKIIIPKSVVKIGNDAFLNIKSDITIACNTDSYAHKWAQKNNVMFELTQG